MFKSLSCVGDMLMDERADDGRRLARAFLTFTYRPGVEWQPRHLTECLKRVRHWVERRGVRFRYLWVAEQHKSGRVHYHAIVWLPRGLTMPKPDKQGWWPHGFTNVQWARKGIGYLVKYATKTAGPVRIFVCEAYHDDEQESVCQASASSPSGRSLSLS